MATPHQLVQSFLKPHLRPCVRKSSILCLGLETSHAFYRSSQTRGVGDTWAQAALVSYVTYESTSLSRIHISATTANIADIERLEAEVGRYFNKGEDESRRPVCFLGADVAEKLFPTSEPLGRTIRIDGHAFEVIGVGKPLGSVFGQSRDKYVAVPLSTFLALYGSRRSLNVSVTSTSTQSYQDAIDEARVVMRIRRRLAPNEKDNFGIITPSAINELRNKIFGTIQVHRSGWGAGDFCRNGHCLAD